MRLTDVYLRGIGAWLPAATPTAEAVADGRYAADARADDDYESVCIEPRLAAAEMAAEAGRRALSAASADPGDVGYLFHSSIWFQGALMWPAASFVASQVGAPGAIAFDLQQQCNAGLAGIELAARLLEADAADAPILVITADRFDGPRIDRWSTESGVVYGDGAAAAVVGRGNGALRIRSSHTVAHNDNEAAVRGSSLAADVPEGPLVLQERFDHFARSGGLRAAATRLIGVISDAVGGALADADTADTDLAGIVAPSTGRTKFGHQLAATPIDIDSTNWPFARRIGHLGAGDQLAGLAGMLASGDPAPGDRYLLIGGGAGFTCTCTVVEWTGEATAANAVRIGGDREVSAA